MLSFELFSSEMRRAARVRYGLRPTALDHFQFAISSLLVTSHDSPLSGTLEAAIPRALGSLRARAGAKIGLYWELYGLGLEAETISLYLVLQQVGEGELLERLEDVPLSERPVLRLRWEEVVPAYTRIWPRLLAVDLPADLSPGLYALYVVARARGREPVRAVRAIFVERS
ncbi:MAG: hypothetical protein PVI01_19190 [Gemmatimonadales bacterium]